MEPLLKRLDTHDYDMLIANSKLIEIKKGVYIYTEKNPSDYLYFIQQGEIRIFKEIGVGKEITFFTRKGYDVFGEMGVFSGETYSTTAKASKHSFIYYIGKNKLKNLLAQNGRLGQQFTRWVAESLESSNAKIRDYVAFGSEGAVASVFIRISNMYGVVTTEGILITEPIMITDISKQIGISRETVSRIVKKWKQKEIIENDNKYFLIKNMHYFRRLLVCENCGVENCVL
ncbi:Crp/Fnr family transcriptional regulator [Virgibacillus sp. NKC19-16]|nr:Crp/Fnr family transcriptional regulator [Virgibacillus sp. NKC19-16]